jgi:hypothetical protein
VSFRARRDGGGISDSVVSVRFEKTFRARSPVGKGVVHEVSNYTKKR